MKSEDALPNTLCKSCEEKLQSFYEFRMLCQKSDTILRNLTQNDDKKLNVDKEDIIHNDLNIDSYNDEDDDLPLLQRSQIESSTGPLGKRKRGRPKKSEAHPYTCTYCNKVLHTAKGLKTHLRVHTGDKMKQCLFCDAKYTRSNHLMRHVITHDKPGVKHPCEHCEKTFEAAADLLKHSKIHEEPQINKVKVEEEELVIDVPDLISSIEINNDLVDQKMPILEEQTSLDQEKTIKDSIIDEDFPIDDNFGDRFDESDDNDGVCLNDEQLKTKKVEGEDNVGSKDYFECEVCQKVLSTPRGLKVHMRRHVGTASLICKVNNCKFLMVLKLNNKESYIIYKAQIICF